MAEHLPQIRSITRSPSVARAHTSFDIREGTSPLSPITIRFPTLPNIHFELLSPIWEANPNNTTINLQPIRWYTEPAAGGTWYLGPSRQMHQEYDVRSWHRVSSSIGRSDSLVTRDGWETQTIGSTVGGNAVQISEETSTSQPQQKERKRDRIRRFGVSIVKRFGKFKSNKLIHRAFSVFSSKSVGVQ